jgi:hypothetical protein
MRYQKKIATIFLSIFFIASQSIEAKGGGESRSQNKLGISAGAFSEGFPALFTYGLHYNFFSALRLSVGYGSFSASTPLDAATVGVKVTSLTGSAKYFPLNWSFSPYVGFHFTKTSADGNYELLGQNLSASGDVNSYMVSVGVDHQARVGFNIGAGVHYMLSPSLVTDLITYVPHFYLGWYF